MLTREQVARVCHEANRAYCSSIGDDSQPPWEDAPEWQKESAVNGVGGGAATPEQSHEGWLKEKVEAGWVYGPTKNADAKEHPCILPYADLPKEQKLKDSLFLAIVKTLTISAGMLLLLGACGTTVTNRMYFERDFMDSNPGREASALADPEVDPLSTERGAVAEPPTSNESGTVTTPISGQSGQGYQILVFSQSGTAAQDVAAQVDAAVRARVAANSPNADLGGNEEVPPPKPDGE